MALSQQAILVAAAATAGAVLASQTPCIADSANKLYGLFEALLAVKGASFFLGTALVFGLMVWIVGSPFAVSAVGKINASHAVFGTAFAYKGDYLHRNLYLWLLSTSRLVSLCI